MEDFRALLYLVKFSHEVPGLFRGWILGPIEKYIHSYLSQFHISISLNLLTIRVDWTSFEHKHVLCLGSRLCEMMYFSDHFALFDLLILNIYRYENKFVELRQVMRWLLLHPDTDPDEEHEWSTSPFEYERRLYHHTSVVIHHKLSGNALKQYLFNLRRAKGTLPLLIICNEPSPPFASFEA